MTNNTEGKYQLTNKEMIDAESMMTGSQAARSREREQRMKEMGEIKSRTKEYMKTLTPEKLEELKKEYAERGHEKADVYNTAGWENGHRMFVELNMARREEVMSIANAIAARTGGTVHESEWAHGGPLVEVELDDQSSLVVSFHPATPGQVDIQYWGEKPDYPHGYPDTMTPEQIAENY